MTRTMIYRALALACREGRVALPGAKEMLAELHGFHRQPFTLAPHVTYDPLADLRRLQEWENEVWANGDEAAVLTPLQWRLLQERAVERGVQIARDPTRGNK